MKKLIVLSTLLLVGCSTVKPLDKVLIPISTKPISITLPTKPYLPIKSLTPDSTPQEIAKAYVLSVHALNNWGESCYAIAKGYQE